MQDRSTLARYERNIDELIADGNGVAAVADIIGDAALKQSEAYAARGVIFDGADEQAERASCAPSITIDDESLSSIADDGILMDADDLAADAVTAR